MHHFIPHFAITIVFALLSFFFPYRSNLNPSLVNFSVLKSRYQKWEFFAIIPFFAFMVIMTYGFGKLFLRLFEIQNKSDHAVHQLVPADWTWFVPACLLSFGLIYIPMSSLYRLILGQDGYADYLEFTNIKHGFDGLKVMRPFFVLFVILAGASLFLLSDYSVKLYQDKIELNPLLTTKPKTINYSEIKGIHFVYNKLQGKDLVRYPYYVIVFDKDVKWIADGDHEFKTANDKKVINYLKEKTKIKIDTLPVYQD